MKREVIVIYDDVAQSLEGVDGLVMWAGVMPFQFKEIQESNSSSSNTKDIVKLKNAGYSIKEIIEIKNGGLL